MIVVYSMQLVALTVVFVRLMLALRKWHRYEYNQNKTAMILFFLTAFIIVLLNLLYNMLNGRHKSIGRNASYFYNNCQHPSASFFIFRMVFILKENFILFDLILVISILYLKSTRDAIQGINKLDYLIKVSVFQISKNSKVEKQK